MSTATRHGGNAGSGGAVSFFNRARRLMRDLLGENERLRAENRRLKSDPRPPAGGSDEEGRRGGGRCPAEAQGSGDRAAARLWRREGP